jgi:hypothetical protein
VQRTGRLERQKETTTYPTFNGKEREDLNVLTAELLKIQVFRVITPF